MSCASSDENSEKDFQIGYVNTKIGDCGEYYTYDTIPQNKETKYVFVSDIGNNIFVNINGKDIVLTSDETNKNEQIHTWLSNSYTVEVNVHIVEQYDEVSYNKGTVTIKNSSKTKIIKVHGYFGC